jgi:hypothetical protein
MTTTQRLSMQRHVHWCRFRVATLQWRLQVGLAMCAAQEEADAERARFGETRTTHDGVTVTLAGLEWNVLTPAGEGEMVSAAVAAAAAMMARPLPHLFH